MARTGSDFAGHSGDYALAISTVPGDAQARGNGPVPEKDLEVLFRAAMDATEEAILNSLFLAESMTGYRGHSRPAVPLDQVRDLVGRDGRLDEPDIGPQPK
jgi:D-aminopeptidase